MDTHHSFHNVEKISDVSSHGYGNTSSDKGYIHFQLRDKEGNSSTIVLHCNSKKFADRVAEALNSYLA